MDELGKRISELESRVELLEKKAEESKQPIKSKRKLTLNEYLKQHNPSNDVERALVIAYWMDVVEEAGCFNALDIADGFRKARLKVPKNVNDKINMNVKNGHMAENSEKKDSKKAWYVTTTGEEHLEKMKVE